MNAERELLLSSFAAAAGGEGSSPGAAHASDLPALLLVQQGSYMEALESALRAVWASGFNTGSQSPESTPDWFGAAESMLKRLLTSGSSVELAAAAEQLVLAAVAALHLFCQANLSGPPISLPECPFDWIDEASAAKWRQQQQRGSQLADSDATAVAGNAAFGRDSTSPGDRWAAAQLSESGEDLIGRIQYPQYLLLARTALLAPLQVLPPSSVGNSSDDNTLAPAAGAPVRVQPSAGAAVWLTAERLPCWCWWALRAVLLQQRLLSGRSAALRSLLLGLAAPVLEGLVAPVEASIAHMSAGSSSELSAGGGSNTPPAEQLLAAGALLETALLEAAYGHVEATKAYLQRSADVLGFHSELAGAMGVRTVHQQEAKAQLLVKISRNSTNPWTIAHAEGALPDQAELYSAIEAAANAQVELPSDLKGFTADLDVLPHPRLAEGQGPATPSDLHSLEQALLLGWCLHVRKGSAADGLQPWEMAAYVDAVARQQRTQFLLHAAAVLQACRLEKARSRTRDRALLQMEQLVESLDKECPQLAPHVRLRYAFSAWFPLRVSLRKELGELLVGMGLVGSALALFEALELWDNLIVCYQLLDKKVQAEELIRRRLEVSPDEPRLWCALGDLCLDDAHYLQAWERSGHRNARSQRSLARNALRSSKYANAAQHWELALALNPLHGEGWFSLGYCYIKERDYPAALRAFTRSSQLEPENGEAWNNLAAIHMYLQHWKQAYNALSEAVKHKRDSWQTWENYAQVAVRVQQWQTAVHALQQVLVLSAGQRVDLTVVAALVAQVQAGKPGSSSEAGRVITDGAAKQQEEQQGSAVADVGDAAVTAEGAAPAGPRAAMAEAADRGSSSMAELATALGKLSAGSGRGSGSTSGGAGGGGSAESAEAVRQAEGRAQEVLEKSVGTLMKQVAATVSGDSAFWELYARYQGAVGYPDAAKECLLKRVRALGGSIWQASPEAFETYAEASAALCCAYLQAAEAGGTAAQRDLSSARLHLRGIIKQAQERYADEPGFKKLQQLIGLVEERQQQQQQCRQ